MLRLILLFLLSPRPRLLSSPSSLSPHPQQPPPGPQTAARPSVLSEPQMEKSSASPGAAAAAERLFLL